MLCGNRLDQLWCAGQPVQVTTDEDDRPLPGTGSQRVRGGVVSLYVQVLGAVDVRSEAPRHVAHGDARLRLQLHHERRGEPVERALDAYRAERRRISQADVLQGGPATFAHPFGERV